MKEFKNYINFKPGAAVSNYWKSLGVKEEEVLFVDIETTGLSSKRDAIYQIGLAYKEEKTAGRLSADADQMTVDKTAEDRTAGDGMVNVGTAASAVETGRENRDGSWVVRQWLCERRSEERELLQLFFERLGGYRLLMHFNGTTFDLPFIRQRALKYKNHFSGFGVRKTGAGGSEHPMEEERKNSGNFRDRVSGTNLSGDEEAENSSEIEPYTPLDDLLSADMFRIFSPLASFLGLPNKKQKSFEAFLGIDREDKLGGGDLIPVYCEYETTGDERLEHYLMIHNHEDMKGMLRLTELFAYRSLREGNFWVESFTVREDRDYAGRTIHELTAKLRLEAPVMKRFVWRADGFYFEAQGTAQPAQTAHAAEDESERLTNRETEGTSGLDETTVGASATAVIRLEEGVMKHFFANYRDYDYLIKEDMAVYRTVGDLVDPSLRKRATAETCYIKREGLFLSVCADCAVPLFRRTYKSKDVYVLAGEDLDPETVKSAVRKGLG